MNTLTSMGIKRRSILKGTIALAALGVLPLPGFAQDATAPIAETAAGKISGMATDGILVFRGVPYAADTGGAGRFMPPQPVAAWADVRDATQYGARSPAADYPLQALMDEEGLDLDTGPMSEDSLFLNVQTPALDGSRPVMVWYHGGGYTSGSGGSMRYEAAKLVAEKGVVLVTVNHRLGVFGFLNLAETGGDAYKSSANVGMLDIVASLQWVQDNIANFGGDPKNVTVFGESGGGGKVTTLLGMPSAAGLFHRVIAQSGLAMDAISAEDATATAKTVLERLGIPADDLSGLADKTWEEILEASGGLSWGPVIDSELLPAASLAEGTDAMTDIPLIIGSNESEANFFDATPKDPIDDAALREALTKGQHIAADKVEALIAGYRETQPDLPNHLLYLAVATDAFMTANLFKAADRRASFGKNNTWVYHFAMAQGAQDGKLGAPHTSEIAYALDNLPQAIRLVGTIDPEDQKLADQMSAAWTQFAKAGDPNTDQLPQWPAYTADAKAVMILDANPRVEMDPFGERLKAFAAAHAV